MGTVIRGHTGYKGLEEGTLTVNIHCDHSLSHTHTHTHTHTQTILAVCQCVRAMLQERLNKQAGPRQRLHHTDTCGSKTPLQSPSLPPSPLSLPTPSFPPRAESQRRGGGGQPCCLFRACSRLAQGH